MKVYGRRREVGEDLSKHRRRRAAVLWKWAGRGTVGPVGVCACVAFISVDRNGHWYVKTALAVSCPSPPAH